MARRGARDGAAMMRHRPQHGANAIADYIQQSLGAMESQEPTKSVSKRRRQRPSKKSPTINSSATDPAKGPRRWTVCVRNLADPQELEDDDEYADIATDLRSDFERYGAVVFLGVERTTGIVMVEYSEQTHATACVEAKHGLQYGGRELTATIESSEKSAEDKGNKAPLTEEVRVVEADGLSGLRQKQRRKRRSKIKNAVALAREQRGVDEQAVTAREFMVRHMVEADEVEDDDEYNEVVGDVTDILSRHGEITKLSVVREGDVDVSCQAGDVVVAYADKEVARTAFTALHDSKYGGRLLVCTWIESPFVQEAIVYIDGMMDPEELQDDDEYQDVCEEVEGFVDRIVDGWRAITIARTTGQLAIRFSNDTTAAAAVETLALKSYGGKRLAVCLHETVQPPAAPQQSERFVVGAVTDFPTIAVSETLATLVIAFLQRLASLQERAHIQNPLQDKRSRRLVLGLHEVRRGLQSHKIKLLLLATDFDTCDVLDDRLGEIIAIAMREEIPMIRALNRRKLGRVLKKHARVSCVGVYSYDGANDQFREILQEHARREDSATNTPMPAVT